MLGVGEMKKLGVPATIDATHAPAPLDGSETLLTTLQAVHLALHS
jgi:hypothetical protein